MMWAKNDPLGVHVEVVAVFFWKNTAVGNPKLRPKEKLILVNLAESKAPT